MNAFIRKLNQMNILSAYEYRLKITEYTDEFPECPDIKYDGFTWDLLFKPLVQNAYNYEECIARILELHKQHASDLELIKNKHQKLIYMFRKDQSINPELFDKLQLDKRTAGLFGEISMRWLRC